MLQNPAQWQIVFYIASAIYLGGAVFYGIFASGERQPWAKEAESQGDEERGHTNTAMEMDEPRR